MHLHLAVAGCLEPEGLRAAERPKLLETRCAASLGCDLPNAPRSRAAIRTNACTGRYGLNQAYHAASTSAITQAWWKLR